MKLFKVNGWAVKEIELVVDGKGDLVEHPRLCTHCLKPHPKIVKVTVHDGKGGTIKKKERLCVSCLLKSGFYLSYDDLMSEVDELTGGRGRG